MLNYANRTDYVLGRNASVSSQWREIRVDAKKRREKIEIIVLFPNVENGDRTGNGRVGCRETRRFPVVPAGTHPLVLLTLNDHFGATCRCLWTAGRSWIALETYFA